MQNNAPLITIGMPVYNGDIFLNQALESLSKQTFTDYEILISDNASIDKTADIIKKWQLKNPKIKYYRQEKNIGALKNFNWLLNNSKSKWFMFAAYDDLWSANYLSELYKKIKENNENILLSAPKVIKTKENGEFDTVREFDKRIDMAK
jgi:glycosyltransferase involved in cell wall biosynthesis